MPTDAPSDIAIELRDVGKTYRLWAGPGSRLIVPVLVRLARLLRPFTALVTRIERYCAEVAGSHVALESISFALYRGESLGIIGRNGSGKSTLLQIVAGVLAPSAGQVRVNGRVAALLELGSGFNPELSGRENVYINAAILGFSRDRIDQRIDEIIAFADIGEYIDQPVKTYSSGMAVRLAFAVQVHIDPDILIVDEALAVGDAAFQAKAMARIEDILGRGTTLLFVGHDLNALKAFCDRAMLLESGRIVYEGGPEDTITEYLGRTHRRALQEAGGAAAHEPLAAVPGGYGQSGAMVSMARINGGSHIEVRFDAPLRIEFDLHLRAGLDHPILIVDLLDGRGQQLTGRRIDLAGMVGDCRVGLDLAASFQRGIYRVRTRVAESPSLDQTRILARQEGMLSFEVVDDSRRMFTGLFPVPMQITVQPCPPR
ncbi:MAG TPA: ABC transporter ATP-binding protein [Xanthomonadales bacterium]|nr:ABC transporter ATP-binding protein [Xanthomonadales bacterium]